MKKIRRSVFETNSSSTHSISLCLQEHFLDWDLFGSKKHKVVDLRPGEFGWEVESYDDWMSKASYCLTWAVMHAGVKWDDTPEVADKKVQEYLVKEDSYLHMLKRVLEDYLDCTVEFRDMLYGYIDHQSQDVCEDVFKSEETLKQFIFCPKSVLCTDNDNH